MSEASIAADWLWPVVFVIAALGSLGWLARSLAGRRTVTVPSAVGGIV